MKKFTKRSLLFLLSICSWGLLHGCGSGSSTTQDVATHFSIMSANAMATAGTPFNITVTALDNSGQMVTTYSGTVHFTSSDAQAALPADAALTNGTGNYSATLKTAGSQTITASATIAGTSSAITVSAAPASQFSISAPATATARTTFAFTVTALDPYSNTATSYSGTVHFTSSDSKAILPANSPLPNGAANFYATTETAGNLTITATDTVTATLSGKSPAIATTAPPTLAITSGAPPNGTVDATYGGTRVEYEFCGSGCYPCTPPACGYWPPCPHSKPCYAELDFSGFTLNATGGVPPYSWNASSLPPGLGVQIENKEVDISGTPPAGSNATYSGVQVTVNDSGNPPAQMPATYTIVIKNPAPPVVRTTPAPPAGAVNLPYSFTFTADGGQLPLTWNATGAPPQGISPLTSGGVLSGTPTATGSFPISVTVQDALGQNSTPQNFTIPVYAHGFKATGSMSTVRTGYTQTLLGNGKVLVAGGWVRGTGPLATAELYDPATGTFAATGSMGTVRFYHTATLLKDGTVLVAGGTDSNVDFATAELYDPNTGKFTPTTGGMTTAREGHTATLLNTNKVLILGGNSLTAELYDPATGSFTPTGSMGTARESYSFTVTLLANGKVLVAGGFDTATLPLATAELYDPAAGTFAPTGSLATARSQDTATLLNTGKVLIAGGIDSTGTPVAIAELYDPATGTFSATGSMVTARTQHSATLLNDGTVLLAGGYDHLVNQISEVSCAELFNATSGTFTATGSMGISRIDHIATLLNDGRVLVTGGYSQPSGYTATAELYQ